MVPGVGVLKLRAAETGAGIVEFAVHPVEQAAIVVGHDALVGFAEESLPGFALEKLAGLPRLGVVGDDAADARDGFIEERLGLGKIAAAQVDGGDAALPEDLVFGGAELMALRPSMSGSPVKGGRLGPWSVAQPGSARIAARSNGRRKNSSRKETANDRPRRACPVS